MKFKVSRASDWGNYSSSIVDINSIEELIDFIRANGTIVMNTETILIYDDYIE